MGALILKRWEAVIMRFGKNYIWAMLFVCIVAAISSFVYACLTKGTLLLFAIFFSSSILTYEAWIVIRMERKAKKKLARSKTRPFFSPAQLFVLDLQNCNEGMSCEEYTTLVIAGPYDKDLPQAIRGRINQHVAACPYHRSETWHQSALGTPVTETLEKAAMEIVKKYS